MFKLIWTFGFILNGAPHIQTLEHQEPVSIEECRNTVYTETLRMHDWLRGALKAPLNFPVAVHGDCKPIQQDASDERDPRCDGPARYEAMGEGADCS